MVGNPSTPAVVLSIAALHASFLNAPCHFVAAKEAYSPVEYRSSSSRENNESGRRHLRRNNEGEVLIYSDKAELKQHHWLGEHDIDGDEQHHLSRVIEHQREQFRETLEAWGVAFLQEEPLVAIHDHIRSLSSAIDIDSSGEIVGTAGAESSSNACLDRKWHPDPYSPYMACSNSLKHPWDEGMSSSTQESAVTLMFDSAQECCDALHEALGDAYGECAFIDNCAPTATNDSADATTTKDTAAASAPKQRERKLCTKLGYHPDSTNEKGCSNSDQYPAPWERDQLIKTMFHAKAEDCCIFFFRNSNEQCPITNTCGGAPPPPVPAPPGKAPPPPPPPKPSGPVSAMDIMDCPWHVDMVNQDGCSNDSNFQKAWLNGPARISMFHTTAGACCAKMFATSKNCAKHDRGCDKDTKPEPPPTKRPTRRPVPRPTRRPVARPTKRPVTQAPTVTPEIYYIQEATGNCISNYEIDKPEWIKQVFPRYEFCCRNVPNTALCLKGAPLKDGEDVGTMRPSPTPPAVWYVEDASGMCVNDAVVKKPDWLTDTYDEYKRCCVLGSREKEKCLENEPVAVDYNNLDGTNVPTPVPAPEYYLHDGTGVCVNKYEVKMSYVVPDTFDDYEECCEAKSWKKAECLAQAPTTNPTMMPSYHPSTPFPTQYAICPQAYASHVKYRNGDEVEVNEVVYRCRPPPHSMYCNMFELRPPWDDPGPEKVVEEPKTTGKVGHIGKVVIPIAGIDDDKDDGALWKEAWERMYVCLLPPSTSPTSSPSSAQPTCRNRTRWHPGDMGKQICTNHPEYPELWDYEPFLTDYFADTADECCDKYYSGKKCRKREICE